MSVFMILTTDEGRRSGLWAAAILRPVTKTVRMYSTQRSDMYMCMHMFVVVRRTAVYRDRERSETHFYG